MQHRGGGHGAGPYNFVPVVLSSGLSTILLPKDFVSQYVVSVCAPIDWLQQATSPRTHPSTTIHIGCDDASRREGRLATTTSSGNALTQEQRQLFARSERVKG